MIFGPLFMILFLAVLVALAVALVRWLGGPWPGTYPPHQLPPASTPLDILKVRFARGEIDNAEYEDRRRPRRVTRRLASSSLSWKRERPCRF